MNKSFYHFVLTFRGGGITDQKARFADSMFFDHSFPKGSSSFEELSSYIETQADEFLTTTAFDELWDLYKTRFDI